LNKSFATLGLLGCLLSLPGHGQPGAGFSQEPEVQAFIIGMHEQHGFDVAHLTRQFAAIHPNATVLRAIRPPAFPEKQRSWQRYRERFVNSRASVAASRSGKDMPLPCSAHRRSTAYRPK
jgi:membrane-bound lytic murein transglycosylase B